MSRGYTYRLNIYWILNIYKNLGHGTDVTRYLPFHFILFWWQNYCFHYCRKKNKRIYADGRQDCIRPEGSKFSPVVEKVTCSGDGFVEMSLPLLLQRYSSVGYKCGRSGDSRGGPSYKFKRLFSALVWTSTLKHQSQPLLTSGVTRISRYND